MMKIFKKLTAAFGAIGLLSIAAPAMADFSYTVDVDVTDSDDGGSAIVTFANFVSAGTDTVQYDIIIDVNGTGALTSLAWLVPNEVDTMIIQCNESIDGVGCQDQYISAGTDGLIAFELNFGTDCEAGGNPCTISSAGDFDACLISGANCNGGTVANGVDPGSEGTIVITASFTTTEEWSASDFEDALKAAIDAGGDGETYFGICARFQGIPVAGSTEQESDKKCGRDGGDTPVPEPGTLGLLGLGLLGMGLARRRRMAA